MSRCGNCYDNALPDTTHAESFWSHFRTTRWRQLPRTDETKLEISHHIACYNAERYYSALGYLAPNYFEAQLQITSQLCPAQLDYLTR